MPAERSTSRFEIKSEDSDASKRSHSAGFTSSSVECAENIKDGLVSDHEELVRVNGRKKPAGHIPRPPNAFILFRSWFIKSQHVSTEVETNHSTLSKIIGMTWQNLAEDERQEWHTKAKQALAEHKRKFPQYTFRPIHTKPRGSASTKKTREVGLKDHKRCAKIAELVASGKTGQELEGAIQEFDKHHIPEIVTRFETPITAQTYSPVSPSNYSKKAPTLSKPQTSSQPKPARPVLQIPRLLAFEPREALSTTPFDSPSLTTASTPSFDYDDYGFSVHQPSPTLPKDNILTQDVSPLCQSYDSISTRDSTLLHGQNDYGVTEWTRNESPFSNSTISMPSTPSPIHTPFAEHPYDGPYISDPSTYASLGGAYGQYPQYSYPPIMDLPYGTKGSENTSTGGYHDFPSGFPQPRMIEQDLVFKAFMESISSPSYCL